MAAEKPQNTSFLLKFTKTKNSNSQKKLKEKTLKSRNKTGIHENVKSINKIFIMMLPLTTTSFY